MPLRTMRRPRKTVARLGAEKYPAWSAVWARGSSSAMRSRIGTSPGPGNAAVAQREAERAEGHGEWDAAARRSGPRGVPRGPERGSVSTARSSLPAGINRAAGVGWERPPKHEETGGRGAGFWGCRSVDRRGVAPSPTLRPKAESGSREYASNSQRGQRIVRAIRIGLKAKKYAKKGSLAFLRTKVAPRLTPPRADYSREPGVSSSSAWCARWASIARYGRSFRPKRPVLRQPSSVR